MVSKFLQGDHSCQRLGFVDFNLVSPLSAIFSLGSGKVDRSHIAVGQDCGTLRIKSTKAYVETDHHGHPVPLSCNRKIAIQVF